MKKAIALILFLSFVLLLAGCDLLQPKEQKPDGAALPQESLLPGESAEPTPVPLEALYYDYSGYRTVLDNTDAEYEETMGYQYLPYGLWDLDGDGILELLVKEGTCEADFVWRVYTIGEMGAKDVGSFAGGHSALYTDDEDGIICLYGQQGYEEITRVTYDGQYLSVQRLSTRELAPGEEYATPGAPLATNLIGDPSLIP